MAGAYRESQGLADALRMLAARKGKPTLRDAPQAVSTFAETRASREAKRLDRRDGKREI